MVAVISVITPVRNGAKYIARCIENVANQGCCDQIEHIVMDGLSTDGSAQIAREFQKEMTHLRVYSQQDKGQSDAQNKAIQISKGNAIGILNVDDFYEKGVLPRATEILAGMHPPALIIGNCNVWDGENRLRYVNKPSNLRILDLLRGWNFSPHPVNPSAYFYHKSLHDLMGWYNTEDHYAMDLDFLLRAVRVGNVQYYDETWGNFVRHEDSKTFKDQRMGTASRRYKRVLDRHRRDLPLADRLSLHKHLLKARYWAAVRWKDRLVGGKGVSK